MKISAIIAKRLIVSLLLLITITGCVTGTQHKDTSALDEDPESPRGPGLFSGKDGKFILFSSDKEKSEKADDTEKCDCESK